jgi:hypothetical protein
MKKVFTRCLAGILGGILLLAFVPRTFAAEEILNNATVIELQKLSLGDGVILEKIKTSKCNFDTSLNGLKQLKEANVSSTVIQAMLATKSSGPQVSAPPASGDINNPAAPHTAGVWMLESVGGKNKMTQLKSEAPAEISRGGFIGPWGIGKVAQTARLTGTESELQLTQRKPEFYIYFKNSSMEFSGAHGPQEIVLAQFTVLGKEAKSNANQRAVDVASQGAYGGTSGIDRKVTRPFEATQVAEDIYKIVPKDELAVGEYGFCPGIIGGQNRFFTFGIKAK